MDMLDYKIHYAVMATEDRARRFRQEQSRYLVPEEIQPLLVPGPAGGRRWGITSLASLVVAYRQGR